MSADQLRRMLDWLRPEHILPAHEWYDRATLGKLRPNDLCLTFDDNLRCQYDVAVPVLREFGLTAFWFVYTSVLQGNIERLEIYRHFRTTQFSDVADFYAAFFVATHESRVGEFVEQKLSAFDVKTYLAEFPFYTDADRRFRYTRDELLGPERYSDVMDRMIKTSELDVRAIAKSLWMDDANLSELDAEGHVIGLHSHTHPTRLNRLDADTQRYEYAQNHSHLTALLGTPPRTMSHPCNSYGPETLELLNGQGVRLGFRANMSQSTFGPLEHPREDHANLLRRMAA